MLAPPEVKRSATERYEKVEIDGEITSAFSCPVCFNFYCKPKILPGCGHSICFACAEAILRARKSTKSLICPECRFENHLSENGLEGLKTNFSIQRAIEIFGKENSARKSGKLGERCPHVDMLTKNTTVCGHCNGKFCHACVVSHLETLKLKSSWIVSIFRGRYEKALNSSKGELLSLLKLKTDAIRRDISASTEEIVETFRVAAYQHRDKLLAELDVHDDIQQAKLGAPAHAENLKTQLESVLKLVSNLSNSSALYSTVGRVVPIYQQACRLDGDIHEMENRDEKLFDQVELEKNMPSSDQVTFDLVDSLKLKRIGGNSWSVVDGDIPFEVRRFRAALKSNDFSYVKELLERPNLSDDCRRFIVDHKDDTHMDFTPLMYAANQGNLEMAKYLVLEHDADLHARNKEIDGISSSMAIHWAAASGHVGVVKFFLEVAPELIEEHCANGSSLLHCAAAGGHVSVIKFLVQEKKASIAFKNSTGFNSLHLAAQNGHHEAVECLIDLGADVFSLVTGKKATVFHLAASSNNLDLVIYLYENYPALADFADAHGDTALHFAAFDNCDKTARFLAELRPHLLKIKNKSKQLPRDVALSEGHVELASEL